MIRRREIACAFLLAALCIGSATYYNYNIRDIDFYGFGIFDNTYKLQATYVDVRKFAPTNTLRDGTVDWTAYIQAAIDSVTTGAHVLIPDGKYLITSSIILSNGTKLNGQGRNFPGPASPHKGTQFIFTGTGPCIKGGNGAGTSVYNVEVSDIEILASGSAVTDNTAVGIWLVAHDSFVTRNAIWMFNAGSGIEFFPDEAYPTTTYGGNFTSNNHVMFNWLWGNNRGIYLHGLNGNTTSSYQFNFINGGNASGTRIGIDAKQATNYSYFLFNDFEHVDRGLIIGGAWNQIMGNTTEFIGDVPPEPYDPVRQAAGIHVLFDNTSLENKLLSHNFLSEVNTALSDLGTRNEYLGGRSDSGGVYVGNKLLGGLTISGSFESTRPADSLTPDNTAPSVAANNTFWFSGANTDNVDIVDFTGVSGSVTTKRILIIGRTDAFVQKIKDNHGTGGNLYLTGGDWLNEDYATLSIIYQNTRWIETGRTPAP